MTTAPEPDATRGIVTPPETVPTSPLHATKYHMQKATAKWQAFQDSMAKLAAKSAAERARWEKDREERSRKAEQGTD